MCYQRGRNAVIVSTWGRMEVRVFRTVAHAGPLPVAHERPVAAVVREPPVVAAAYERPEAAAHGRTATVARGGPEPAAPHGRPAAVARGRPEPAVPHGQPAAVVAHERPALLAKARERPAAARWAEPLGLWKVD